MLLNLHIKNMALIDEIEIDFADHLNILTGETGAGKSIVIDSIMIALGGKAPKNFVRQDAEYGLVELLFSVENPDVIERLAALDVADIQDGQLILSRKIMGGRSISKVNGETVTLSRVREIAALLLDLHAQHEHQSLLVQANHLKLLDRYGNKTITPLKEETAGLYAEYETIRKTLEENTLGEDEIRRRLDLIGYEQKEIEEAALKEGEDTEVEERYKKAANSRNISEGIGKAYQYTEETAVEALERAIREMTDIVRFDEELAPLQDSLATAADLLTDFGRNARSYLEENTFSEEEFRQLENRLDQINHLKVKYGKTIPDILQYAKELQEEYERLADHDRYVQQQRVQLTEAEDRLTKACAVLSRERKKIAATLVRDITEALRDLNFLDVRFDMQFDKLEHFSAGGTDKAVFMISTNVGEDIKPLSEVASGGELSRIMLAMKSCLADVDRVETLIFDEIDVGISGRTAQMVAEKIHRISAGHQVICITHLPQIAAMASHHYLIQKQVKNGKTVTDVFPLDKEQEITELARLIGGVEITDTVMQSAREMKELADKAKVN